MNYSAESDDNVDVFVCLLVPYRCRFFLEGVHITKTISEVAELAKEEIYRKLNVQHRLINFGIEESPGTIYLVDREAKVEKVLRDFKEVTCQLPRKCDLVSN